MKRIIAICLLAIMLFIAVGFNIYYKGNNNVSVIGKFDAPIDITDINGNTGTYYQFKSNDNEVWWLLNETEMGFIPNTNIEYILTYNNNGTIKANKPCDCAPQYECECEVYDDEFVSIKSK